VARGEVRHYPDHGRVPTLDGIEGVGEETGIEGAALRVVARVVVEDDPPPAKVVQESGAVAPTIGSGGLSLGTEARTAAG
jgi:hypothetical protein